jgi:co-chaperonin GroES (HSP10)
MPFKPLYDRVVVKELPPLEVATESGIILEKTAIAQAHTRATVISVGSDVTAFKSGDIVLFGAGSGNPILIDGEELLLLRAEQIDIVL